MLGLGVACRGGGELQVYLLFEHKSRPEYWILLQLLRYAVASGEEYRKQHPQARQLPPVYPLVLYLALRHIDSREPFGPLRELLAPMRQIVDQTAATEIFVHPPALLCSSQYPSGRGDGPDAVERDPEPRRHHADLYRSLH